MSFTTIHSNRVENLRAALVAEMFGQGPTQVSPLIKEYVLVDNRVLGDWVNLQLAQAEGIAANINYIQPHQLFWELARAVVSAQIPRETPLSKEEMTWVLYGLLEDKTLLAIADMLPVKNYLAGESNRSLKQYQFAASVADLFDQYLVYRPDWIIKWSAGKIVEDNKWGDNEKASEQWQRLLWMKLQEQSQGEPALRHRAEIEKKLLEKLAAPSGSLANTLPMQRLFVFGMTAMPPRLLDMLMLLGKHIAVSVYVLNPCEHHWFDIESEKKLARLDSKKRIDAQKFDIGNPLLASQGTQVQEFVASIYNRMDQYGDIEDLAAFSAPGKQTLLQCIQQEILDLEYRGKIATLMPAEDAAVKQAIPAAELNADAIQSLHIHSCHSALREVEVLHDQLLAMFNKDPTLNPRDVVVMMPRVTPYVACIHSVFHAMPYHISDRTQAEESPLLNSLVTLLRLPESRLPLSEVLALLEVPAIQRRFNLDYEGYTEIKRWLVDAGVRWGLDSEHRQQAGLPAYAEASWEFGFNRLMAGYALSSSDASLLTLGNSIVQPYDYIEGSNSSNFDALLVFWKTLRQWRTQLNTEASAGVWAERLRNLLDDFFDSADEQELTAIRAAHSSVAILDQAEERAWFKGKLPLAVIRDVVQPALQQSSAGQNHWREGIKFCSLMPMRGVPFKVVYIMGMNMEDYPRRIEKRSFDLMRKNHRAGDRASRIDDRWLFLEALLSARQFFHISYIGRDIFRNEKREPSVVLSELIDYCRHGYDFPAHALQTEHPLQPFSDQYFRRDKSRLSPRLVSFNKEAWNIASAKNGRADNSVDGDLRWKTGLLKTEIPTPVVALNDFIKFFTRPGEWFFTSKHKVWLEVEDNTINDNENFGDFNALDKWQLRAELIKMVNRLPVNTQDKTSREEIRDALVEQIAQVHNAQGSWPLGAAAEVEKSRLKSVDADYLWASYGKQDITDTISIGAGVYKLVIDATFPIADSALIIHSAGSYKIANKLDFYIRLALAVKAGKVTKGIACFNDKKADEILAHNISEAHNNTFLSVLTEMYQRYQESGLPFEPELSHTLAHTEDADEREEVIEEAWNKQGEWGSGIAYQSKKRSYYGHIDALRSDIFLGVSQSIWSAVDDWL